MKMEMYIGLFILAIFTEFLVYCFLVNLLNTIKHYQTAKTYRKGLELGVFPLQKDDRFF